MKNSLPLILVLAVVAIGLFRITQYHWREGTVLIGGALVLAAVLRALLSDSRIGMVALRSRAVDVLIYGGLGIMVMAVSLTITGGPLNQ
jgi:Protein of unknown function (DUF3017)